MRQEFIEECKVVGTGKKPVVVDIKTADGTPAWTYLKSGTVVTPELQQNLQALHDQIIAPYSKKANERIVKEIQEIYKQRNPQKGNQ
jgi:hypothetical protein